MTLPLENEILRLSAELLGEGKHPEDIFKSISLALVAYCQIATETRESRNRLLKVASQFCLESANK